MVTFNNNNRRSNFRRGDRNFKSNGMTKIYFEFTNKEILKENRLGEIIIMHQN